MIPLHRLRQKISYGQAAIRGANCVDRLSSGPSGDETNVADNGSGDIKRGSLGESKYRLTLVSESSGFFRLSSLSELFASRPRVVG